MLKNKQNKQNKTNKTNKQNKQNNQNNKTNKTKQTYPPPSWVNPHRAKLRLHRVNRLADLDHPSVRGVALVHRAYAV